MLRTFIGRALSALGMYPGSSLRRIPAAWQGTSSLIYRCRFPTSKMNQLLKLPPAELVFHAVKSDAPFPNGQRTSPTLTAFPKGSGQRKLRLVPQCWEGEAAALSTAAPSTAAPPQKTKLSLALLFGPSFTGHRKDTNWLY